MAYTDRASLYSEIIRLTKLIEGGLFAAQVRERPTRKAQRTIHFFDSHTLEESIEQLAKLKAKEAKLP
jgi:hypothetical protein